jgi:hypothetical protein
LPIIASAVHAFPSLHEVGQFPSQVSPASVTPLPQRGEHALSLFASQPEAQQVSPLLQAVIPACVQRTLHCDTDPVSTSVVHASPSLHDVGQLPSHVSGGSVLPLPHEAEQSPSLPELHDPRQQPSPLRHVVTAACVQRALHWFGLPTRSSTVQGLPSSQDCGQFPSQSSGVSTTPLPHAAEQFGSFVALQPVGQHISFPPHVVIGALAHCTLHCSGEPMSISVVQ